MSDQALKELGEHIAANLGDAVLSTDVTLGELAVTVRAADLPKVLVWLRDDPACRFRQMIDLTAVDWPAREARFDLVYHLLSMDMNQRVRVKAAVAEGEVVASVVTIFHNVNWYEREVWDMFGIPFAGHPDLRRILSDYGFEGHPLRKDFPLTGHVEVRYDDELKRVVYEPVKLAQDFRSFDFLSPWEGMTGVVLPGDEKAAKTGSR